MTNNLDKILDECIDRINRGESVDACLADYPEYSKQLRPLLQAMFQTKAAYTFVPSASAKMEARQRFNAVLEGLERKRWEKQSFLTRVFAHPAVWATVAAVLVLLIGGYFGLRPVLYPAGPVPTQVSPVPDPAGNFVFLISDDVNAIDDFESLNVSISKVGLQMEGEDAEWVEFTPEVETVDLTLLQGDKAQEIWRGDVPQGQYTNVFIHVSNVSGVLKDTGEIVDVKLPSDKLHISKPFEVTSGEVTNFVYDITVIATGSPQSGIKYILKPQVGESGADQKFEKINRRGRD